MPDTPITDQFYLDLVGSFFNLKWQIMAEGLKHDLGGMQALTLLMLNELTPRSMKELCNTLHCDASNVTGIIDGLEQRGLVERRNDPSDRRIKTLHILPAGKELQQQILDQLVRGSKAFLAPLTDSEMTQFVSIVQKLATNRP
ncbi:MAG TPA: MarR family transcriptional regulator [Candidatus Saccharimonadia bacterium]|nr:MarR family transcriptional regulator [Candidatus Saccharimonadia bacterium]